MSDRKRKELLMRFESKSNKTNVTNTLTEPKKEISTVSDVKSRLLMRLKEQEANKAPIPAPYNVPLATPTEISSEVDDGNLKRKRDEDNIASENRRPYNEAREVRIRPHGRVGGFPPLTDGDEVKRLLEKTAIVPCTFFEMTVDGSSCTFAFKEYSTSAAVVEALNNAQHFGVPINATLFRNKIMKKSQYVDLDASNKRWTSSLDFIHVKVEQETFKSIEYQPSTFEEILDLEGWKKMNTTHMVHKSSAKRIEPSYLELFE